MGIGLIMHIIAKIVFVLVGYGIHMYLGKPFCRMFMVILGLF